MRGLLLAALVLALAFGLLERFDASAQLPEVAGQAADSFANPIPVSRYSAARPPQRFQGNATFKIRVAADAEIPARCGDPGFVACEIPAHLWHSSEVIISNPCLFDGEYARRLCHELGHVNGWPSMHGP